MAQKSIKELQELDISQLQTMDLKELRKITNNMASAVNKRLRRAEAGGWDRGDAFQKMKESGGAISTSDITKGMKNERQKLIHEFSRGKNFLQMKTSSKRGVIKREQDFEKLTGLKLDSEEAGKFWAGYRRIAENNADMINRFGSDSVVAMVKQYTQENAEFTPDDIYSNLNEILGDAYEEYQDLVYSYGELPTVSALKKTAGKKKTVQEIIMEMEKFLSGNYDEIDIPF